MYVARYNSAQSFYGRVLGYRASALHVGRWNAASRRAPLAARTLSTRSKSGEGEGKPGALEDVHPAARASEPRALGARAETDAVAWRPPPSPLPEEGLDPRAHALNRLIATHKQAPERFRRALAEEIVMLRSGTPAEGIDNQPFLPKSLPSGMNNVLGIFANKDINLRKIDVWGFDYDYTLAAYREALLHVIYDLAREHLVRQMGYPSSVRKLQYDPNFAVRGLFYDRNKGTLLKLDFVYSIETSTVHYGRHRLSHDEVISLYGGTHIPSEYMSNLRPLSDLFCLPEACLVSDIVEHFNQRGFSFDPRYVYDDINKAIAHVHISGTLHRRIMKEIATYVHKSVHLAPFLARLRNHGKKTFILSNSPFEFVNAGMEQLIPQASLPDPSRSWTQLFDAVMTLADKPNWYSSDRPFRAVSLKSGGLKWTTVKGIEPGKVYAHGNLRDFNALTKYAQSKVLYIGDHIYTDLLVPSRTGWRTAVVLKDLEHEISVINSPEYPDRRANLVAIQDLISSLHMRIADMECDRGYSKQVQPAVEVLDRLKKERDIARKELHTVFNNNFGSAFVANGRASLFAYKVQRVADVYTSRLSNFLNYPVGSYFHADRRTMPHQFRADVVWDPNLHGIPYNPVEKY